MLTLFYNTCIHRILTFCIQCIVCAKQNKIQFLILSEKEIGEPLYSTTYIMDCVHHDF